LKTLLLVTNNAPEGLRGFLSSVSIQLDSCVYLCSIPSYKVKEKIVDAVTEFHEQWPEMSVFLLYSHEGGQEFSSIGPKKISLVEHDGIVLSKVD
jgi:CRISPR-associated endoribonuclease Cas2 subtype I-E